MWTDLWYRLRAIFRRRIVERELEAELQFHREHEVEKLVRSGMCPADAERQASLTFGALEQIKDECRDARGISQWDTTGQDIRHALRGFQQRPAFFFFAVLMLSLGIGTT